MATYVLVHGGDRDGTVWDTVAKLLKKHPHQVFCPSMTSIKLTTLQHNINEICELIHNNNLHDIILVGHSYGAMVITGVINKLSDKISYAVYVDSIIPKNGKSLFDILAENGFDYQHFGLTPDTPCIEPLYFDENKFKNKSKAYIHCLQSEFIDVTKPTYKYIADHSSQDHWLYFSLDTLHGCMFTQPNELAVILFGVQMFLKEIS